MNNIPHVIDTGASVMNNEPALKGEPVAWIIDANMTDCDDNFIWNTGGYPDWQVKDWIPLYTHPANPKYDPETGEPLIDGYPLFSGLPPPPAKTLTDEEIIETVKDHFIGAIKLGIVLTNDNVLNFARTILRKAQEK